MLLCDKTKGKSEKQEYKSAIRSRKLIRDAFIKCLDEKSADKISVTDIVKTADINRSTFYAHYRSPEDVIKELADEFISELDQVLSGFDFLQFLKDPAPSLQSFLNYINTDEGNFRKLATLSEVSTFINNVKQRIYDYVLASKSVPLLLRKNKFFAGAIDFFVNAIVYSFRDKISENPKIKDEDFVKMISYFITQNLKIVTDYVG